MARVKRWGITPINISLRIVTSDENDGDEPRLEFSTISIQNKGNGTVAVNVVTNSTVISDTGLPSGSLSGVSRASRHTHTATTGDSMFGIVVRAWENDRSLERDREENRLNWSKAITTAVHAATVTATDVSEISLDELNAIPFSSRLSDIETSFRNDDELIGSEGLFFPDIVSFPDINSSSLGPTLESNFAFRFPGNSETDAIYTLDGTLSITRNDTSPITDP